MYAYVSENWPLEASLQQFPPLASVLRAAEAQSAIPCVKSAGPTLKRKGSKNGRRLHGASTLCVSVCLRMCVCVCVCGCGVCLTHTHIVTVRNVALISLTNMTWAAWNKHIHLEEQPENFWLLSLMWWLLSLMWWSWIMQPVSPWLVGPNPIPRACGLVNCLLKVFLYNYSPSRQNSCETWVNSLAETVRVRLQSKQMYMLWCNRWFHHKQITSYMPPVTVTLGMLKEYVKVKTQWHWLE